MPFCAFDVVAGFGVDDYGVPCVDEERGVDLGAGVELHDFSTAGGGVALDTRRGLDDLELHFDGQVDVDNVVVPAQSLQDGIGLEKLSLVADEIGCELEALRGILRIDEPILIAMVVEEFNLLAGDISHLEDIGLGEVTL